jgi:hypothetical protein
MVLSLQRDLSAKPFSCHARRVSGRALHGYPTGSPRRCSMGRKRGRSREASSVAAHLTQQQGSRDPRRFACWWIEFVGDDGLRFRVMRYWSHDLRR